MVHGCFWHHHGCKYSVWPKTRAAFWRAKIDGNKERDRRNARALRSLEWRVITIWECRARRLGGLVDLPRAIREMKTATKAPVERFKAKG